MHKHLIITGGANQAQAEAIIDSLIGSPALGTYTNYRLLY